MVRYDIYEGECPKCKQWINVFVRERKNENDPNEWVKNAEICPKCGEILSVRDIYESRNRG